MQLIIICDNFTRKEMQTVIYYKLYIAIKIEQEKFSIQFKFLGEYLSDLYHGFQLIKQLTKNLFCYETFLINYFERKDNESH